MDERLSLQARIASLEKELAEIKSKPSATLPTAAPAAAAQTQLGEDVVEGLRKDVATVTNAVATMMESLHDIVDSLNSLQEEVSGFATQQNELTSTVSQSGSLKLDNLLRPVQTLSDTVNVIRGEISGLKKQTSAAATFVPSDIAPVTHPQTTTNLERLVQEQNARIDTLTRHVAGMQTQMASISRQQQATGQPQTLRQAMAAAEQDLRHHLNAVQRFYHSLNGTRRVASRATTERTADFLALLTDGLEVAKAWES
jgi:chromosome segregation ATPase